MSEIAIPTTPLAKPTKENVDRADEATDAGDVTDSDLEEDATTDGGCSEIDATTDGGCSDGEQEVSLNGDRPSIKMDAAAAFDTFMKKFEAERQPNQDATVLHFLGASIY